MIVDNRTKRALNRFESMRVGLQVRKAFEKDRDVEMKKKLSKKDSGKLKAEVQTFKNGMEDHIRLIELKREEYNEY